MIRKLLHKISGGNASDQRIMVQSAYTFGITVANNLLAFAVMMALTRTLGAKSYGDYSFAFAAMTLIGVLSLRGFDKLLIRELAKHIATGTPGLVRGIFRWSGNVMFVTSLILGAIGFAVSYLPIELFENEDTTIAYRTMLIGVPVYVLMVQRQSGLQGIKQVVVAQIHDKLVRPVTLLALIGIGVFLLNEWNVQLATKMALVAFVVALIVGELIYRNKTKHLSFQAPTIGEKKDILKSSNLFLVFAVLSILTAKVDIFMLGGIQSSTEQVGVYTVALRIADLMRFFLMGFNLVLAPTISGLFAKGDMNELQNTMVRTARLILILSIPVTVFLVFARDWYLPFFGEQFIEASAPLLILVCGQFVSVAAGSVGNLLIMTKNERYPVYTLTFTTILNIVLNLLLIPDYGIWGAAIATATSMILNNVILLIVVMNKLKINPTAFGRIKKS